jgi:putative transposase
VSLHGNVFAVDPALVGHRVEAVFDLFDLTTVEIRYHGRSMGQAVPHVVRRHAHPKARPELAPPPGPTGIDYLKLIEARHAAELADRLRYAQITEDDVAGFTELGHHQAAQQPDPTEDGEPA